MHAMCVRAALFGQSHNLHVFAHFFTLLGTFCLIFKTFKVASLSIHIFLQSKTLIWCEKKTVCMQKVRVRVLLNFGKFTHVCAMCVRPKIKCAGVRLNLLQ